jgi:hypothetical protein
MLVRFLFLFNAAESTYFEIDRDMTSLCSDRNRQLSCSTIDPLVYVDPLR